ncbi:MAG: hypothetical protein AB2L20_17600 [Mangrovibacterium sp.]
MKKIIYFLCLLILLFSCREDDYSIPRDENGDVIFTDVSTTTTTGISTLDDSFTVTAVLPNAKQGDVMTIECLQLQAPSTGGSDQLLPLDGTQKTVTVGSDLTASVTYTRDEANLVNVDDYVTVTFSGKTDYAIQKVEMISATATTKPQVSGIEVSVARNDEVAYFNVTVEPKSGTYTGTLTAKRKNGVNDSYVNVSGSPFSGDQPFMVPISGADFAAGKDTMYYSFIAQKDGFTDEITTSVIVLDPYFFLKKTATLTLGGAGAGRDLLTNAAVAETDSKAMIALSGTLSLRGGSAWLLAGNTIEFVSSTEAMYSANKSNDAIAAFNAGTKTAVADPVTGGGVYIFKAVTGTDPEDVYYGMMKVTSVVPDVSVTFEYRIGNRYAHLAVIK